MSRKSAAQVSPGEGGLLMAEYCEKCGKKLDNYLRRLCADCYQDELEGRG